MRLHFLHKADQGSSPAAGQVGGEEGFLQEQVSVAPSCRVLDTQASPDHTPPFPGEKARKPVQFWDV